MIRATRSGPFRADVTYGSISGTTAPGAEVTVASPPPTYSGGRDVLRELDIPSCANYFGVTRADAGGAYSVGFLPVTGSANTRYLVGVRHGSTQAWYGRTDQRFGSCYDATSYQRSRRHLIALTGPVTGKALSTAASGNTLKINARYASSYKPTAQGDRWIRLREKVPGVKILDAPVVAEGAANSAGVRSFSNLRPGRYWVEVGRRTGCADWYPSKYSNNNQYFKGMDRASERWKSFRRLRDLPGNAQRGFEHVARTADPNPARGDKHNTIPRGYKGWMYRGYCKALGAGTISTVTVSGHRPHRRQDHGPHQARCGGQGTRHAHRWAHQQGDDGPAELVGGHPRHPHRPHRRQRHVLRRRAALRPLDDLGQLRLLARHRP